MVSIVAAVIGAGRGWGIAGAIIGGLETVAMACAFFVSVMGC